MYCIEIMNGWKYCVLPVVFNCPALMCVSLCVVKWVVRGQQDTSTQPSTYNGILIGVFRIKHRPIYVLRWPCGQVCVWVKGQMTLRFKMIYSNSITMEELSWEMWIYIRQTAHTHTHTYLLALAHTYTHPHTNTYMFLSQNLYILLPRQRC